MPVHVILSFVLLLFACESSYCAVANVASLKPDGKIVEQKGWVDKTGRNFILITETGHIPTRYESIDANEYSEDAELHAVQYRQSGDKWKVVWRLQDFVRDCSLDFDVKYLPGSLQITDLDKNGESEVTFLYELTDCRGDVEPSTLKLIMREGAKKYAIRGETILRWHSDGEEHVEGGTSRIDPSFDTAPVEFMRHAMGVWKHYQKVTTNGN